MTTLGRAASCALTLLVLGGCAARVPESRPPRAPARGDPVPPPLSLSRIGFSVQVGAFSDPENAIRLRGSLEETGLEPFHFTGVDGLHRVRFGSFDDRSQAAERAEALRREGVIGEFFVVPPERRQGAVLRREVVRSAMGFLGSPYRWGGASPEMGLDCSGLTMTSYRLVGVALPRTSREQFASGDPVGRSGLREGDLVFFEIEGTRGPSHVGLYIGDGRFVHAPGRGKVVQVDTLSSDYFRSRFLSGRSYLE
jgi:hypothetical protein